jgi:TRAP-type C4-dicarboxylate transport system permease small subunit
LTVEAKAPSQTASRTTIDRTAALAGAGAGTALAIASAAMFGQVIARYGFNAPIVWAEELATLMFAWITFLGAAVVQRDDSHLGIDVLRRHVDARAGRLLDRFRLFVIAASSLVLAIQGSQLAARMAPIRFPAMEITRAWLYASVAVGAAFTLVFAIANLLRPRARAVTGPGQDAA